MAKTAWDRHTARLEALKQERTLYETLWTEFDQFGSPGRLRLTQRQGKGDKKDQKLFDGTSRYALRTFVSGMQSGQTSPSRPWFRLVTEDPDMLENAGIKDYLWQSESRMRQIMQSSNLYNIIQSSYADVATFGTSVYLMAADDVDVFRAIACQPGSYWIAQNHIGRVDTLYRRLSMTVEQVVGRFVAKSNGDMNWANASDAVQNAWDRGDYDQWLNVWHAIEPRKDRDGRKSDKQNMRIASNYWEDGCKSGVLLEESGFNRNPIMASRWETMGDDIYGTGHPAEVALADIKMLQQQQRKKGIAIDKKVDPPMVAPTSLKNQPSGTRPGSITYVDATNQNSVYRPAMEVNLDLAHLMEDSDRVRRSIDVAYFVPLFTAISSMEGVQPKNVFELTQRKEEQLLQLGPVIDRQQHEHLNPLIDWMFATCAEANMFPEPPQELQGSEILNIEHISLMAQAQRAVATGAIERVASFVGSLAGLKPDIIDKIDLDQSVDEYAEMVGAPPRMIRSDDDVAQDREARAKQQQAAAAAEMAKNVAPAMQQSAQAAKLMAETGTIQGDGKMMSNQDLLARLGIMG